MLPLSRGTSTNMVGVISSLMLMLMVFAATIPGWLASQAAAGVAGPSNNSDAWRYQPALAPNAQASVPIENMLNKDGTLKLDTGFTGSLDPTGWLMEAGETGQPRFVRGAIPAGPKGGMDTSRVPGDEKWDPSFGVPGIANWGEGAVNAIAVRGSDVYVGGKFVAAEGVIANNIAKWNGSEWSSLNGGVIGGGSTSVESIAISGNDLYVGGNFTAAGGISANSIARWDGTQWHSIGPASNNGVNGFVRAIGVNDTDVYVSGGFSSAGGVQVFNIAHWDGTQWTSMNGGLYGTAYVIKFIGSDVYAAGSFSTAGGHQIENIARWDGSDWYPLGPGVGGVYGSIHDMVMTGDGDIYIGGGFNHTSGGLLVSNVAKWDGSEWHALGTEENNGVEGGLVQGLTLIGSDLYLGGSFTVAGGVSAKGFAKWDGNQWSQVGEGVSDPDGVTALASRLNDLYVGGKFTNIGGVGASQIARWDVSGWHPLTGTKGKGLNDKVYNQVNAIAVSGDSVYVGGAFSSAGTVLANNIARWSGGRWYPLGSGPNNGVNGFVGAMAVGGSSGTEVYVGGDFTMAGGISASRIARWNGTQWSAMGSGLRLTGGEAWVNSIAISGSTVYAGGVFDEAGGLPANYIARWNGTQWSSLGSGLERGEVYAIAVIGNDIYAGGTFSMAGGATANRIARWDGTQWHPLLDGNINGVSSHVYALAVSGNDLYVGGVFTRVGNVDARFIAKWDGSTWSSLGSGTGGFDHLITAVTVMGDDVYVGGNFNTYNGTPTLRIARWDGSNWSALGSGVSGFVEALAVKGNELFVGGNIFLAGGRPSNHFASWYEGVRPTPTPAPTSTITPVPPTYTPIPVPPRCPDERFTDVCPGDFFYEPVLGLSDDNIISGYSTAPPCEGPLHIPCFKPASNMTRGQVSKIVANAAGFAEPVSGQSFQDVPTSNAFYLYIERMAARGIIGGYACGSQPEEPCVGPANRPYFRWGRDVTRGQLSKMVSQAFGFNEAVAGQTFEDVPPANAFYVSVERIARRGIIGGYPCGSTGEPCGSLNRPYFRPNNAVTRGQTSKMVYLAQP